MDKDKALESVNEIKRLMERSSKFISFSGIMAITVGIYTLLGVFIFIKTAPSGSLTAVPDVPMIVTALLIFIASAITSCRLSFYKSKRMGQPFFSSLTYRAFWYLSVPMLAGGIFSVSLWINGHPEVLTSVTLIFYGLALVNASKYADKSLSWLGYAFICLGLADSFWPNHGLLLWTIGFGGFHLIYGILFYLCKEKEPK